LPPPCAGDEALPYSFVVGNHGVPSWDARMAALHADFQAAFCAASPDFQAERGYPQAAPGTANLSICSKHVSSEMKGARGGCAPTAPSFCRNLRRQLWQSGLDWQRAGGACTCCSALKRRPPRPAQVGERFKCLAVTLEQPFKDNADLPEPEQGWSPERARKLGASMLDAVLAVAPKLR
jgi:murein tripeptide amidase MpaA